MRPSTDTAAARRAGLTAAVAFWVAAVVFVADLSVLSGWVSAAQARPDPDPVPTLAPTVVPTTEPLPSVTPSAAPTVPTPPPPVEMIDTQLETGAVVRFPGTAQRSEQLIDVAGVPATLVLYSLTNADESHFSIGVIEYPAGIDLSDPAVILLGSVSGAAGNVGGRIVDKSAVRLEDAPAITFEIEVGAVRVHGRNVLDGRVLYTQSVSFTGDSPPPHTHDFFASLQLP